MRFLLLVLIFFTWAFSAYPRVFESHGKSVYPFMEVCKPLQKMKGELGRKCQTYYKQAQDNIEAGLAIDARRNTLQAGDPSIKNYIKVLQSLRKQQIWIKEEIDDRLKQAIRNKDAKVISELFVLPQIKQSQKIYRKIGKLNLKLSSAANKKLQVYLSLNRSAKSIAAEKSEGIRAKKNKTLRSFTCVPLSQMDAIKSKQGMVKAIVAGKTKGGYVLEVLGGKHFFLSKHSVTKKYAVLDHVAFEAKGKGRAQKVTYSYSDGVGRAVRRTETLPVIAYVSGLKTLCKDK
jgi:hypothetical protein